LQLLIEVGDTGDTSAVDIPLRDPQVRIALETNPIVPGISPNPLIKKDFFHPLTTNWFFYLDVIYKLSYHNLKQISHDGFIASKGDKDITPPTPL
jgi:hypothetical protein